jgi:predicted dehydrogenase
MGLVQVALDSGADVVCEKPLAPTAEDARTILDAASARDRVVVESHNLLYNDPIIAIDRLIEDDTIGAVREVSVDLALDLTAGPFGDLNLTGPGADLPAGAVHDFAPHLAYLLLHFADHDGAPDDVVGALANLSGNTRVGFDHLDALVRLGEVRGHLRIASDVAPASFVVEVRGTRGTVRTDLYNPYLDVRTRRDEGKRAPLGQMRTGAVLATSAVTNLRDKVLGHDTYHGLPRMLDASYAAFVHGAPQAITPDDIVDTAALVDRLVQLVRAS